MEKRRYFDRIICWAVLILIASPAVLKAQSRSDSLALKNAIRQQYIAVSKTNENHRLLATTVGEWTFTGKHISPDPNRKPMEFAGAFVKKELWGDRYFVSETTGGAKIKMPWTGDSLVAYQDMMIEGYDNVTKKFFLTSMQNEAAPSIINMDGEYDSKTKTLTYQTETTAHMHADIAPGTPFKIIWLIKLIDKDHFILETNESVSGKKVVTTILTFTRIERN